MTSLYLVYKTSIVTTTRVQEDLMRKIFVKYDKYFRRKIERLWRLHRRKKKMFYDLQTYVVLDKNVKFAKRNINVNDFPKITKTYVLRFKSLQAHHDVNSFCRVRHDVNAITATS